MVQLFLYREYFCLPEEGFKNEHFNTHAVFYTKNRPFIFLENPFLLAFSEKNYLKIFEKAKYSNGYFPNYWIKLIGPMFETRLKKLIKV